MDIVTADFKVERMKLDEIKAAGIDITAPEHQHVLEVKLDLAYKVRRQDADFFAFDDSFTAPGSDFSLDNPDLANVYLDAVPLNLTRHSIICTLGFKF